MVRGPELRLEGSLKPITKSPRPKSGGGLSALRRPGPGEVVLGAAFLYAVVFSLLAVWKHEIFASYRFDLGNMDQAVWNTAHGRILEATDEQGELSSRLQNHADFFLILFAPLYWLRPSPYWLLVAQAAVVGLGALPLFWLSRRFLRGVPHGAWVAALISVAYLFHPGLQAATLFDFHAQTMAGTLLLFAFHYLLERRAVPFVVFAALAASTKEEISLIVAMMGLYALFFSRQPRWGIPVFAAGAGYFLLIMLVVIPAFNAGEESRLVGERYAAFGGSMGGVIRTAITEPVFTVSYLLSGEKLHYLAYLAGMTGFLGLLAPHLLVLPLPEVGINLLSERPQMVDFRYQYSAPIIPFTFLAGAAGIANLRRLLERARGSRLPGLPGRLAGRFADSGKMPLVLAFGILLFGVQMDYEVGPLPGFHSPANPFSVIQPPPGEHLRALEGAVDLVPESAKVSATNNIGPHLSHRRYVYLFPMVRDAEYVVLDETTPGYGTEITPVPSLRATRKLHESEEYRPVYSRDGVLVFRREG